MPDITGKRWAFPVNLGERDRVALTEGDNNIRQALYVILNTVPGERVMRPQFGCRIHELIFAPANDQTAAVAERFIYEAINRWEPRITLNEVRVTPAPGDIGMLYIELKYTTKHSHDRRSLVYPFYLKPE